MANHLIIGLGGTGGKVLRELRKRVYEEFHSNNPDNGVFLEYIYVDSSPADLDDRTGWKVMGKSVHLLESQKVSIHGVSASMFQNLSMYPGIKSFLSSEDVSLMTSKLGPLITAGIGGQRRRLGRTLFANNLSVNDNNSDFVSRLKQTVQRITDTSGDAAVTFHICAGLAGGTGSGSIIDAIAQIRKEYPPQPGTDHYKVHLYLYVPEMNVVNTSHDAGFYQANGYAALCELNAMSVHKYLPYDVSGKKDNYTGEVQRLLGNVDPFEAAYLYTNINEKGKVIDIAHGLPTRVADFIFQKIVASSMTGDNGQMQRLVGCENDGAGPENDLSGEASRSRKFLTFGIKRIEYPETEIREYVAYNFARQSTRQLEYNFWQEGIGYGECTLDDVGSNYLAEIKDTKNREKWMLSNSYLMLSRAIIENPASARWEDIDQTWDTRTEQFADEVQCENDKKSWLSEFALTCEQYYNEDYRTHGVKKFYEYQRAEKVTYAKHIRRHIETTLFNEWLDGSRSVLEVEKYARLLMKDCEERIADFKKQIGVQEDEIKEIVAQKEECKHEWDNIGWLRDAITGASKKIFSSYKTAQCDYYRASTRIEAYRYATELLQVIIEQLGQMLEGILAFKQRLGEILEEVNKQADSRCRQENAEETMIMKKYDPEVVQRIVKSYITDKDIQHDNARDIRQSMVKMLGEDGERSFTNLYDNMDYNVMTDTILEVCQSRATDVMNDTAKADPINKMLGVNILEKLKQEYNSDEKLEQFVRSLKDSAMSYLQFNSEEQGKVFTGNGGNMMKMLQLCLPKYEEDKSGFRDKLINMFVKIAPGFNPKTDVAENYKSNQIVLVSAASGFPLRYVTNVKVLKERYEDMLASPDKELNRMVLHTETFAKPLPSLFEMDKRALEEMFTPCVILGYGMGLFEEKSDPTTGERFHAINIPDEFGDSNWMRVGKNIIHTIEYLSEHVALGKQVMNLVENKLKREYRSNDQKVALRQSILQVVKTQILPHPVCENNEFSPVYQRYKAIARKLFENELKEL